MKKLYILIVLIPSISFGQVQIGQDIDGEAASNTSGNSIKLSSDGSTIAIGAMSNFENGNNSGHIRIYEDLSGIWTQIGQDIDGDFSGDFFGRSIGLSSDGNIVAAGATQNDFNSTGVGYVRIYQNLSGVWTQIGQDIQGTNTVDLFGSSVSLSSDGSIIAVSAPHDSTNGFRAGQVKVYENQASNWVQIGQDINGEVAGDNAGWSLSLSSDGSILAVSSIFNANNGSNSGHVRVFENQSGNWIQIGNSINGEAANDISGNSVALSSDGSFLAIGSPGNDGNGDDSGHVRIYENQSGSWIQVGNNINGEAEFDQSGFSVSLSSDGSIVAIGSPFNNGNGNSSGHVRIYENQFGVWTQIGSDIDGEASGDNSGSSVSLSSNGSIIAISGPNNDGNGGGSGHVRVYDLSTLLSIQGQNIYDFGIYPNPAKNQFTIQLENSSDLQKINIYNNLGQLVLSSKETTVYTSQLTSGLYIVKLETANGKGSKKLIIE